MTIIPDAMKYLSLPAAAALLLASGCAAPVRAPTATADLTAVEALQELTGAAGRRFIVEPERSDLRIVLYPDGPLARLGHPHVIGGAVLSGEILLADEPGDSWADLRIAVRDLEVDRPEWRAAEGFEPELDREAVEGTRRNLLGDAVLDAEQYPDIRIRADQPAGALFHPEFRVRIELRGEIREMTLPVAIFPGEHQLEAGGRFTLLQSDFGIEPFSAAGGSLRVADGILLRFRIGAREAGNPEQ